jgi:hypothetical protein
MHALPRQAPHVLRLPGLHARHGTVAPKDMAITTSRASRIE